MAETTKTPATTKQKVIFGAILTALIGVFVASIFMVNSVNNSPTPEVPGSGVTDGDTTAPKPKDPTNPDEAINNGDAKPVPTSPEEEADAAQQAIIEQSEKNAKEQMDDKFEERIGDEVPNADKLQEIAAAGAAAYCTELPGEKRAARTERLKPFFAADSSPMRGDWTTIYKEKRCEQEVVVAPRFTEDGDVYVLVGMAWSGLSALVDNSADAGYSQYVVTLKDNAIIKIND